MQGWAKVKNAAAYADVSERTFRNWLKEGLRHVRLRGTIRIKFEWIDEFLESFSVEEDRVEQIVDDVMKEINL